MEIIAGRSAHDDERRSLGLLKSEVQMRGVYSDPGRGQGWQESSLLLRIRNEEGLQRSESQADCLP
jgi:hypothetical protein